jgi:ABC-type dipeptide/oligopeptide/nickel transport system ATPase component
MQADERTGADAEGSAADRLPDDPVLSVENLVVSYASPAGRRRAVDDLTFEVRRAETYGLVGESGSGKSSTAFAILGLIKPPGQIEGGRIRLEGTDLVGLTREAWRPVRWRRISLVPQGAMNALNPVMRVGEQIGDAIEAHDGRQDAAGLRERIVALLESVGLTERVVRAYPHELSGGMKQRACIAMAIALEPALIIADEPTSALDVVVQRAVAETLMEVKQRIGASVILIGHDLGLQAQMVDRLGVMYRGRLVETGPSRELFHHPQHPYTELLVHSVPSIRGGGDDTLTGAARRARELAAAADELAKTGIPPLRLVGPDHWAALP